MRDIHKEGVIKSIYKYKHIYTFLAMQDIKSKFRGSKLGILWIAFQHLITTLVAGLLWSRVFGVDSANFIPFLALGILVWNCISSAFIDGSYSLYSGHHYLKQFPLSHKIFIFKTICTNFIYFGINFITTIVILIYYKKLTYLGIIYLIPSIFILVVYFYGASGMMSYLGMRYRDIHHAVPSLFGLIFIVTPVLFSPQILVAKGINIAFFLNPFASLIEIIRFPILNGAFAPIENYAVSIIFTSILLILHLFFSSRWYKLIAFWS
jgi:lipopolysaccharide transport system permease protein